MEGFKLDTSGDDTLRAIARVIAPSFDPSSSHEATRNTATMAMRKARTIRELCRMEAERDAKRLAALAEALLFYTESDDNGARARRALAEWGV